MAYENLLVENKGQVAWITINRPSQLNALNKQTIAELRQALEAANNDQQIGVVILTGSGEKSFVAGADIKEFANFSVEEGRELSKKGHDELFNYVSTMNKPVIAAVNGFALGGGLELAMACHIRIASDNAKMGLPETSLGVIPGYGGTQRLAQYVGKGKACEMVFTAGMITAEDAYRWGLVNDVCPLSDLYARAEKMAEKILKNSPAAIASAIRAINAQSDKTKDGFATEIDEFGRCFGTDEFKEGTSAFLEKRKPNFR